MENTDKEQYLVNRENFIEEMLLVRKEKHLSQKKMSELCGLSQPTISRIESGDIDPGLKTLMKYLNRLNKTIKIVDI